MQLYFIQVAFFFFFFFIHIGMDLCSQTNGNTQVKLMDIEWGLDGTPTFSKLIFVATFVTCCNHNHQFFRNYLQDVCDN